MHFVDGPGRTRVPDAGGVAKQIHGATLRTTKTPCRLGILGVFGASAKHGCFAQVFNGSSAPSRATVRASNNSPWRAEGSEKATTPALLLRPTRQHRFARANRKSLAVERRPASSSGSRIRHLAAVRTRHRPHNRQRQPLRATRPHWPKRRRVTNLVRRNRMQTSYQVCLEQPRLLMNCPERHCHPMVTSRSAVLRSAAEGLLWPIRRFATSKDGFVSAFFTLPTAVPTSP